MPKISINIQMPDTPPQDGPSTLCEYVEELIDDIESGYPSLESWKSLRRIFNRLARSSKLTCMQKRAFDKAEPIVKKYGLHDTEGIELAAAYPHEGYDTFQYSEKK